MHSDSRPADATVPADTGPTTAPGAVNAHTHVYSGLAPLGIPPPRPEPETFLHILERLWWRLDRALDPDSLRAAARLYVAEAARDDATVGLEAGGGVEHQQDDVGAVGG